MKVVSLILAMVLLSSVVATFVDASSIAEFEPSKDGIYNYCPAAFEEGGVRHIYYCSNTIPRDVTDSIAYRTARMIDGRWLYSDESIVLEHTKHWMGWDTVHVCDPDVVKGQFSYKGENYNYLMAYLGCSTTNNQNNEIGLAVAKAPGGPFIKIGEHNPIVPFERDRSTPQKDASFQWGVGQPSLVSIDKKGKVLLFYTSGKVEGTFLFTEHWDFSNLDAPVPIGEHWRQKVNNAGLIGRDKHGTSLNNAEAVYEPSRGTIFLIADGWPHFLPETDVAGEPQFISATLRLLGFSRFFHPEDLANISFLNGKWTLIDEISIADSGFPRNHNAGLVHDPYGWALHTDQIDVLYSISLVNEPSLSLWTYRIHLFTSPLETR